MTHFDQQIFKIILPATLMMSEYVFFIIFSPENERYFYSNLAQINASSLLNCTP